jgi:nicotinate phosphoribosyltransferase
LTNDFSKVSDSTKISKPLNIVIKLSRIDGHDCVKLSDDKGKVSVHVDLKLIGAVHRGSRGS